MYVMFHKWVNVSLICDCDWCCNTSADLLLHHYQSAVWIWACRCVIWRRLLSWRFAEMLRVFLAGLRFRWSAAVYWGLALSVSLVGYVWGMWHECEMKHSFQVFYMLIINDYLLLTSSLNTTVNNAGTWWRSPVLLRFVFCLFQACRWLSSINKNSNTENKKHFKFSFWMQLTVSSGFG